MEPLRPIDTRPLFAPLHAELMTLLRGLDDADWTRPTVAGSWRVRDVVAHLLDVQVRDVSSVRDGHLPPPDGPIDGYDSLVAFLDRLNAGWVRAAERISPCLLVDLLDLVGTQAAAVLADQTLDGPATFAVDWAGVDQSAQWMHVGRQYTEYWHHQMQIRDAVGTPRLLSAEWLVPLLDLSMRALPRSYASVAAPTGTTLAIEVTGDGGGSWTLRRSDDGWALVGGAPDVSTARIQLDDDESWRLLYNARSPEEARQRATITGDERLAEPLFRTRSVMVRDP